jgi:NADH-quinone oxidoreductase subunit L
MSQIGYMFVAAGLGAYGAGLFHLMTHAFFKALLFMAAGVVIHALAGEQDIRRMGGLARKLPWTYRMFLVGALSLAAIPPFAGFWSKDAVLASAANAGTLGWILWAMAAAGAFLTGLYTFRLVFVVFRGPSSPLVGEHLHLERFEGPLAMMWPVAILTVLATVAGFLQIPGIWKAVDDWVEPAAASLAEASGGTLAFSIAASLLLSVAGIVLAWTLYGRRSDQPQRIRARVPWAARTLEHKFYFDEAYDLAFSDPSDLAATELDRLVERPLVLRPLDTLARGVRALSRGLSAAQTGFVRAYALALGAGAAIIVVVFISVK